MATSNPALYASAGHDVRGSDLTGELHGILGRQDVQGRSKADGPRPFSHGAKQGQRIGGNAEFLDEMVVD
jgi:hypothetical protein